ncbi:GAF and ANTAR domain-containing protein [Glaciihabitans sp. dw_435]|uniref:GAF and ANTAR domain-containing protein n=1 Tax=Glaciihabitans sp. dw_435 TaxID=2720081 RepID=UPI001BD303B3|nr:GAF and ANTAR domain-containing protein [Glaciihabitans sp. dw_435]
MANSDVFDSARRELSAAHERNTSLCAPFLAVLPVEGAALSVLSGALGQSTVCSSDAVAARLDEMQFDLGEGPCWQAMTTHRPVLAPNLRDNNNEPWPIFAEAVRNDSGSNDVRGMFAFPLVVGTLDLGAVDLYTREGHSLSRSQVTEATALADVAAWQVLRKILGEQDVDVLTDSTTSRSSRREVHQATGMVLAQLGISADEAALLIRAHAFASGRSVREVATDIVERRLDFSTPDGLGTA